MLTLASWWPQAEALKVGQKRRVPHECGEGRTLIVSRTEEGYRAWCFRCNEAGGAPPPAESLGEKLARLAAQREGDASLVRAAGDTEMLLPLPAVRRIADWPEKARLWLYRAGFGSDDIGRLGLYYHAGSDRVVLPVFEAGVPVFWQARALDGRMPKYLGPTPKPPKLLARWGRAECPTLTEDMLSSMKIGDVAEGWAVLGTSISNHMIGAAMKRKRVNVWLDPDAAGRKAAARYVKQLRAYGVEVRDIISTRDPKLHTRSEIQEILS